MFCMWCVDQTSLHLHRGLELKHKHCVDPGINTAQILSKYHKLFRVQASSEIFLSFLQEGLKEANFVF